MKNKQCLTHLLNPSTSTEAHIRVVMTLHLTVVVAVCLREHKANTHTHKKKDFKVRTEGIKYQRVRQNTSLVWSTVQPNQLQVLTVKYKGVNYKGILFCQLSRSHSCSSPPQANDGWSLSFTFPSASFAFCRYSQVPTFTDHLSCCSRE